MNSGTPIASLALSKSSINGQSKKLKGLADTGAQLFSPGATQISSPRQWNEGHRRAIFNVFCYLATCDYVGAASQFVRRDPARIACRALGLRECRLFHQARQKCNELVSDCAFVTRSNQFSSLING
jgi:hypothetical protein